MLQHTKITNQPFGTCIPSKVMAALHSITSHCSEHWSGLLERSYFGKTEWYQHFYIKPRPLIKFAVTGIILFLGRKRNCLKRNLLEYSIFCCIFFYFIIKWHDFYSAVRILQFLHSGWCIWFHICKHEPIKKENWLQTFS